MSARWGRCQRNALMEGEDGAELRPARHLRKPRLHPILTPVTTRAKREDRA